MDQAAVVSLTHVSKAFGSHPRRSVLAVDDVSLTFDSSSCAVGIVGESGSGKSTLARILVGLLPPSSGTVVFNGTDLGKLLKDRTGRLEFRRNVQFIGQDTTSSFDPHRTLRDAVRLPVMKLRGLRRPQADEEVDRVLTQMALPLAYADRKPHQVSGGQRQRFAIARGLVVTPRLLVCDETVSALDVSVQGSVLNLLKKYCADNGAGLVFISHGLPATAFLCDDLVVMYRGKIVDHSSTANIIGGEDVHPYTASLLDAYRVHQVGAA
jgi:peptide/nickel transport system ATP-binding protein